MTIHFTNQWPDSALDWFASIGIGVLLGLLLTALLAYALSSTSDKS